MRGQVLDPTGLSRARPYSTIKRTLNRTEVSARFRLSGAFDLVLRAIFEKYFQEDPTEDRLRPTMSRDDGDAFQSAYLGGHVTPYDARVLAAFLRAHW